MAKERLYCENPLCEHSVYVKDHQHGNYGKKNQIGQSIFRATDGDHRFCERCARAVVTFLNLGGFRSDGIYKTEKHEIPSF